MMNLLSIDTTADLCSIALQAADQQYTFHESRPREHAKILLPEIQQLLQQAGLTASDLDLIVVGRGPGSFTGVRIATSVAQGLALAADCPILPVSTLQSVAYSASLTGAKSIWVALDARMSEWYFCRYQLAQLGNIPQSVSDEVVIAPKDLQLELDPQAVLVGNGWQTDYPLAESLQHFSGQVLGDILLPHAQHSLALAKQLLESNSAQAVAPEEAIPIYLRDKVTWDNKPKVGS
ncbi:tRNA (adenosine(37)-N6)-threonylcarbamoyltransferase complex dimerization subunit type 1 TsaB [Reinekea thalattae]|uniref:tRNA threonylcarbamoyladenosine biosynthesis protein TsaB n=1 Tax=Reinekea thalattae TaxID=2593301 RepID=A0A5C8Z8V2_9GAMM|nr:tRNA (adenosine(37)-N6)-threonylcarbamoyltransferase complex dimerization subunit type 1 TsaB [Reinekea thalattae]TXR53784.1 tRNA (adenosine(37)-N6)-threonylcarbamoyltransferase complex dimerization subunit type 1 TsaB [Reinekea thalattae]